MEEDIVKQFVRSLSDEAYLFYNLSRQLKFKGQLEFTDKHDYPHLLEVAKNIQKLIDAYPEYNDYWIKNYSNLHNAKMYMSFCAFYHDLMRGKGLADYHGEAFYKVWENSKLIEEMLYPITFEMAQAIKRHTFPLPPEATPEDIFLKTADSLDTVRYGNKINVNLLPLKDSQERISKIKDFEFIDFIPAVLHPDTINYFLEKTDKRFIKFSKRYFQRRKKELGDPIPPKVEDLELEKLLETQRAMLNLTTSKICDIVEIKEVLVKKHPNHDLDECPAYNMLSRFVKGFSNHFHFQGVYDYDLKYLYEIKGYLPKDILARHLIYYYLTSSHPTLAVGSSKLAEMFEYVSDELKALMRPYEKKILDKLPEEITIYRGISELGDSGIIPEISLGVSWTVHRKFAESFSSRKTSHLLKEFLGGYLLSGTISKKDILFLRCPTGSNKKLSELFVNPKKIKNLKVIKQFYPEKRLSLENVNFKEKQKEAINDFLKSF